MSRDSLPPGSGGVTPPGTRLPRPRIRGPGAGRPRKSGALHVLHGTRSRAPRRPHDVEEPVAPADVPPELLAPAPWLHKYAKAFWIRNALRLATAGRLKSHHLDAWTALCERWGTYERASRAMNRSSISNHVLPACAIIQRQAWQQFSSGCLRFGIDPATDIRMSALDGSEVSGGRPATPAPAAASEQDRGDAWLREHGKVS